MLDASYYPSDIRIPGIEDTDEAYDALNSALAVNFNTINAVRKGKAVSSAEPQTPITPLAISQFRARGPQGRSRISLTQEPVVGLQYAGELISAFVERAGGSVKGKISTGAVPEGPGAGLRSPPVARPIEDPCRVARRLEQLHRQPGLPGDRRASSGRAGQPREVAQGRERAARQAWPRQSIHLEEGSGISRGNRFTARGLAQLLHLFEPNATLLRRGEGARYKTGTFSGVRTLAGYADTANHGRVRFVIALTSNDGAMRFRLLKAIQSEL